MYRIINEQNQVIGEINIYGTDMPIPEPSPEPSPEVPASNKKIALVIGHNVSDKGAYGNEGISEWDFNEKLLRELPLPSNCKLFYRDETQGYTNQMIQVHEEIDQWGADYSIEWHFNSFSNDSAQGHEVLYCSEGGETLATMLNESYDANLPTTDRGIKKITMNDNGGGFCCRGHSYSIIAEPFFGAHQYRFIEGGDLRSGLKKAMMDFIASISV